MSKPRRSWGQATLRRKLHEKLGSPPSYKIIVFRNDVILVPALPCTRVLIRWHLRAWLFEIRVPPPIYELLKKYSIGKPPKHYVRRVPIVPQATACYVMKNVLKRYFESPHKYENGKGLAPISFTRL